MLNKRNTIVGSKPCECGCGQMIPLKTWHFKPWSKIPQCIGGHNPASHFRKGNKIGWHGGLYEGNGYIYQFRPEHPFCNANGYVKRARLHMEHHLGRFLYRWEHVHHINGITTDDRIENLAVLTIKEHLSLHHTGTTQMRNEIGQFTKEVMSNEHSALNNR